MPHTCMSHMWQVRKGSHPVSNMDGPAMAPATKALHRAVLQGIEV